MPDTETPVENVIQKTVQITPVITVKDLANKLEVPVTKLIAMLIKNGIMATINESLDFETAAIITEEFGFTAEPIGKTDNAPKAVEQGELSTRPPVVTIMGHVDHGKTTLLDTIRETNVAGGESGGITQHIAAYQVSVPGKAKAPERRITFLDTPGHAAFTAMREHGANITDIVVLVVAADDGIKPQTIEAIDNAKQANVTLIVAITKIDKPGANLDRIKQQLAELELVPEEWGGKTIVVPVSAVTKQGIDTLLEMILLVADLKDLKASAGASASGVVIESHIQPGKGPTATILIQNGALHVGDSIAVGSTYGKVRTLEDFHLKKTETALPSDPVIISGFNSLPSFGEQLVVTTNEKEAKESAARNDQERQIGKVHSLHKATLEEGVTEDLIDQHVLPLLIKADVVGSLEAVRKVLEEIGTQEVSVTITQQGVGPVTESDVTSASATKSSVLAFRVPLTTAIRNLAEKEGVVVTYYDVIYDLVEDAKKALSKLLPPEKVEVEVGKAKIIALFKGDKRSRVVGVQIEEGVVKKDTTFHLMRKKELVADGVVLNLRRGKEEVNELESGQQAGVSIPGTIEAEEGDILVLYRIEIRQKSL